MKNNILENIIEKIEKGEEISPFLFLGKNKEKLNLKIEEILLSLLEKYSIDSSSIFKMKDDGSNLKIKDVKEFLLQSNQKPRFEFQVFFIENISRFTLKSANSCLKFFEEPGKGNLIFLSNFSEGSVLETILSRVQVVNLTSEETLKKDEFFYSLIDGYLEFSDTKIFSYFFTERLEKQDYINFLKTLILYIKDNLVLIDLLDELEEDINLIGKNNLLARYIVDKYLLMMDGKSL